MDSIADALGIVPTLRHTSIDALLDTEPDIVIVCTPTTNHAEAVERVAERGAHLLIEKPFALSSADAERMIEAQRRSEHLMVVNWPLAYYPTHRTTRRLIAAGVIGAVTEVHYYDGNRGPWARMDAAAGLSEADAWWFDRKLGGGSLQDYLGYGVTLATWFLDGQAPERVIAAQYDPASAQVDTHTVVTASYPWGLATFQTRWGTITDPWIEQSLPRTGFTVVGTHGALESVDYAPAVRLYERAHPEGIAIPVDEPDPPPTALAELIAALETGKPPTGPASPELSLIGQRIVDAAVQSAATGASVDVATGDHAAPTTRTSWTAMEERA